ncbi:MAG: response regulator [Balneolales bacterium]
MEKGHQVLCVEDNADNQLLLSYYLKKNPCKLTFAKDGFVAIDMLKEGKYDLFLIDINLPNGMDGFEVARVIRQNPEHREKPILIISAFSKSDIQKPDDAPYINGYLSKPIRKAEFIEALDYYLNV